MKRFNRLWIWISAVLLGVVLIVAFFPITYRYISGPVGLGMRPPERSGFEELNQEEFRQHLERRFWRNVSITLAVGAAFGLTAGLILTRALVSPLQKLEEGARAIARGEMETRIQLRGSREMRAVAQAFNQMAAELALQEKLRRDLLADVTHELRHPIHILQGNLQAILDGVYPMEMEEIARLAEQTQGLTNLVGDLHELALAEARQLPMHKRPTELSELVVSAIESFQPLIEERNIHLKIVLPGASVSAEIDADRLRQALQNIIGNAIRYTPEGGIIEIGINVEADTFMIYVQDNGIGINSDDLKHIFDRFYRADAARDRTASGAGLGLAIAQAIVQAHGGTIEVASDGVGKGSLFTVRLPLYGDQA